MAQKQLDTVSELPADQSDLAVAKTDNVVSKKKKVYRSIFGPLEDSSDSSSSETDLKCHSDDMKMSKLPLHKTREDLASPATKSQHGLSAKSGVADVSISPKTENVSTPSPAHIVKSVSPKDLRMVADELSNQLSNQLTQSCIEEQERQLYMGPYGKINSPFKKNSSFQGFASGVKRSPRKMSSRQWKRLKMMDFLDESHSDEESDSGSSSTTPTPEDDQRIMDIEQHTPDKAKPVQSHLDKQECNKEEVVEDSDDDQWQIVETDEENDIDKQLQAKSDKFSLSAINVKSIIHKIITNDSVVEMVREAVLQKMEENGAKYEPKITRSKLKQYEAQGQVPTSWGLSPSKAKCEGQDGANFLEMELPDEEEDDEDFNPDKHAAESDEDSESVMSSCISDIGSPAPSTPRSEPTTPSVSTARLMMDNTPSMSDTDNSQQSFLSPMGPPLQSSVPRSHHKSSLGQKYQDRMEAHNVTQEEELIPFRTRSKYPLTEHSILEFEANFVAPDISEDLYDTACDDHDWKEFLTEFSLLQQGPGDIVGQIAADIDDEEADPEYNFLESLEQYEIDQEDFRDDRAVKVSRKEVNLLLDELYNTPSEHDTIDAASKRSIKTQSEKIVLQSGKKKEYQQKMVQEIGEHERKQINDQLRKHVQLLSQSFVMAQNRLDEHQHIAHVASMYLKELKMFADRTQNPESFYRACNLESAVSLLDTYDTTAIPKNNKDEKEELNVVAFKYENNVLAPLNFRQMYTMWSSPVFMFPDLLPHGGFFRLTEIKRDRSRLKFLPSEDNLIALGLSQFSHLKNHRDYIQKFMLPCKSTKQIAIRIKNLCSATAVKGNAVQFWKKFKKLPEFEHIAPEFDISEMKAVKERNMSLGQLPHWCKYFSAKGQVELYETLWQMKDRLKCKKVCERDVPTPASDLEKMLCTPITDSSQHTTSNSGESSFDEVERKKKRPKRQYRRKTKVNKRKSTAEALLEKFVPIPGIGLCKTSPITVCMLTGVSVTDPLALPVTTLPNTMTPVTNTVTPVTLSNTVTPITTTTATIPSSLINLLSQQPNVNFQPNVNQQSNVDQQHTGSRNTLSNSTAVPGCRRILPSSAGVIPATSSSQANVQPLPQQIAGMLSSIQGNRNIQASPQVPTQTIIVINPCNPVAFPTPNNQRTFTPVAAPTLTITRMPTQIQNSRLFAIPPAVSLQNNKGLPVINTGINVASPSTAALFMPTISNVAASNVLSSVNTGTNILSTRNTSPNIKSASNVRSTTVSDLPINDNLPCNTDVPSSKAGSQGHREMPTFEELCRPIMEAEQIPSRDASPIKDIETKTNQSLPDHQMQTSQPLMETQLPVLETDDSIADVHENNEISIDAGDNSQELENSRNMENSRIEEVENSVTAQATIKNSDDVQPHTGNNLVLLTHLPTPQSEIQSEVISSTTPENKSADEASGILFRNRTPDGAVPRAATPTVPVTQSPREATLTTRCLCTPTKELGDHGDGGNQSADQMDSCIPAITPKSAIEKMAAYAPIFISSLNTSTTSLTPQQLAQETTPNKQESSRYVKLLPKPTPPSTDKVDPAMFRKSPRSSSRRKQFKQQAKAILPKGFIMSTFDTSPAKKAASTLVDRAKQQVKGFCNILPRPPELQQQPIVSPIKLPSLRTRQVRKNLQVHSSFSNKPVPPREIQPRTEAMCYNTNNSAIYSLSNANINNSAHDDNAKNAGNNRDAPELDDGDTAGCEGEMPGTHDDYEAMETDSDFTQSEDECAQSQDGSEDEAMDTQGSDEDAMSQDGYVSQDGYPSQDEDGQGSDGDVSQGTDGEAQETDGEDGNDTQGTDLDSQEDSQEEDEGHMADLMTASTTLTFAPIRDEDLIRARLGKKDRDRDTTLAMLAPDIIEADPQHDLRDTLFVQSYLQQVKKVLKTDLDKLEKFLKIISTFDKTGNTPIELYKEIEELFVDHPDLLHDFAGFLQPEQAIQCGCYKACMEFQKARIFLRQLEIFFSKNINPYQKLVRILHRWYRRPEHKEDDLRDQIEPLLKGNKYLLQEFSKFFPNDKPAESVFDEFEEVALDDMDSGEEVRTESSFEDIELLDLEETQGTKRCSCDCHDSGDDTYKKRKKHCYKCCLTVIDGELVYRVNKSTIKKINVTLGPPVKFGSDNGSDSSSGSDANTDDIEMEREPAIQEEIQGQEPAMEPESAYGEPTIKSESTSGEPTQPDWLLNVEDEDKENIDVTSQTATSLHDWAHEQNEVADHPTEPGHSGSQLPQPADTDSQHTSETSEVDQPIDKLQPCDETTVKYSDAPGQTATENSSIVSEESENLDLATTAAVSQQSSVMEGLSPACGDNEISSNELDRKTVIEQSELAMIVYPNGQSSVKKVFDETQQLVVVEQERSSLPKLADETQQEDVTVESDVTEKMVVTQQSDVTKQSNVTEQSDASEQSAEQLDITQQSNVNEQSGVTALLNVTQQLDITQQSDVIQQVIVSQKSVITKQSDVTKQPNATRDSDITQKSDVTQESNEASKISNATTNLFDVTEGSDVTKLSSETQPSDQAQQSNKTNSEQVNVLQLSGAAENTKVTKQVGDEKHVCESVEPTLSPTVSVVGKDTTGVQEVSTDSRENGVRNYGNSATSVSNNSRTTASHTSRVTNETAHSGNDPATSKAVQEQKPVQAHTSFKGPINISTVIKTLKRSMAVRDVGVDLALAVKPAVVSSRVRNTLHHAPSGESELSVSRSSSFSKVKKQESSRLIHQSDDYFEMDENEMESLKRRESADYEMSTESGQAKSAKLKFQTDTSNKSELSRSPPFSPFGQELQNINAASNSAAANTGLVRSHSSTPKIRRITPIPVKWADNTTDSSSSFHTVMMNSPVLVEVGSAKSPKSPFQSVQSERSNSTPSFSSVCNNVVNSADSGSSSLGMSLHTVISGSSDSGSNPKLSVARLDSATSSNSNQAGSHSSQLGGSQSSSTCDAPVQSSISISAPVVFSENANVAFPKVEQSGNQPPFNQLLSDESLFQCISKPQFSDTLQSVSNLTNILHALDGKSQSFTPVEQKTASVTEPTQCPDMPNTVKDNQDFNIMTANDLKPTSSELSVSERENVVKCTESGVSVTQSKDDLLDSGTISEQQECGFTETCDNNSITSSSSSDSSDVSQEQTTSELQNAQYLPQCSQSIENIERIKQGLYEVSRLSDSDSSCKTTPSTSASMITSVASKTQEQADGSMSQKSSEQMKTSGETNTIDRDIGNSQIRTSDIASKVTLSQDDSEQQKDEVNESEIGCEMEVTESDVSSCKEKQSGNTGVRLKMSRRELRRSLQADEETLRLVKSETDPGHLEGVEMTSDTHIVVESVAALSAPSNLISVGENCNLPTEDFKISTEIIKCKSETTSDLYLPTSIGVDESKTVKTEVEDTDDVSEASSKGIKRKSKHKKKHKSEKKKKKRKEDRESESPSHRSEKKSKRRKVERTADADQILQQQLCSDAEVPCASGQTTDATSEVLYKPEEPNWSKEMDKTILEACKQHGIKEKTFVKIARTIENVTAQQVQKRFCHLYQMIFGMPFGEQKDA